jgi:predicted flap endonuclease-1-like 5' DNA nuclease
MPDREEPESELTPRIGRTATRALALEGITRHDQLTTVTASHLLAIHGIGPKAIRILREELAARGLAFAEG